MLQENTDATVLLEKSVVSAVLGVLQDGLKICEQLAEVNACMHACVWEREAVHPRCSVSNQPCIVVLLDP